MGEVDKEKKTINLASIFYFNVEVSEQFFSSGFMSTSCGKGIKWSVELLFDLIDNMWITIQRENLLLNKLTQIDNI